MEMIGWTCWGLADGRCGTLHPRLSEAVACCWLGYLAGRPSFPRVLRVPYLVGNDGLLYEPGPPARRLEIDFGGGSVAVVQFDPRDNLPKDVRPAGEAGDNGKGG